MSELSWQGQKLPWEPVLGRETGTVMGRWLEAQ